MRRWGRDGLLREEVGGVEGDGVRVGGGGEGEGEEGRRRRRRPWEA